MCNVINVFSCDSKINKFKKKLGIFYFAFSWKKFQIGALISSLAVPEIEQYVWIGVLAKKKQKTIPTLLEKPRQLSPPKWKEKSTLTNVLFLILQSNVYLQSWQQGLHLKPVTCQFKDVVHFPGYDV